MGKSDVADRGLIIAITRRGVAAGPPLGNFVSGYSDVRPARGDCSAIADFSVTGFRERGCTLKKKPRQAAATNSLRLSASMRHAMLSPPRHNFRDGTWRRTVTVPRCPHLWRSLGGEIMPDSLRSPAVQLARDGHEFGFDMCECRILEHECEFGTL